MLPRRPLRYKPMRISPIRFQPIRIKPIVKVGNPHFGRARNPAINDRDFDGVPDHLDCNPHNALQQDDGTYKTTDPQYIPPEGSDQESYVISPEEPKQGYFSGRREQRSERDAMRKAQSSYDIAHGEEIHLFLQEDNGEWQHVDTFSSQQFNDEQGEIMRTVESILENPRITNYKFSKDQYFAERQQMGQERSNRRDRAFSKYSQRAKEAMTTYHSDAQKKEATIDRKSFGRGAPDIRSLMVTSRTAMGFEERPESKASIGNLVRDMNVEKPNIQHREYDEGYGSLHDTPNTYEEGKQMSPDYQEKSLFPMHVPYRPINTPFLKANRRKPLFRIPFLRRI